MKITMVAACSGKNKVIGNEGVIPWNIPSDLRNFKKYTDNKIVIMGRATFQSLPVFLKNRVSIILSSNVEQIQDKVSELKKQHNESDVPPIVVYDSVFGALESLSVILENYPVNKEEVVVIGGESIYKQFLPIADKVILSLVDGEFHGDKYFPTLDRDIWTKTAFVKNIKEEDDNYSYSILTLESLKSNVYDFSTGNLLSKMDTFKYL